MKLSIVTPVYGCCKSLHKLYERLNKTLSKITDDFEIIMINDASPGNPWKMIKDLSEKDDRVKGINLSRNFGQHKAITAGLDYASGDWIVVMDCDLQDQPEEIIKLYNKAKEGYDVVFGRRAERKDGFLKKLGSKCFYTIYDYLTGTVTDHSIANFSIISNNVLKNYNRMNEQHRPYGYFVSWLGFKRTHVDIDHAERSEGKSSYTFNKLIILAFNNIVSQTNKPLILSIKLGFTISATSALYTLYIIFRYLNNDIEVAGWTTVIVSIYFIGGLLLANMGILGLYIGKTFDETKNRPLYIVQETTYESEIK